MPEPLRIVMADDNYLVREGARRLLEDSGNVVVAAAVAAIANGPPRARGALVSVPAPQAWPAARALAAGQAFPSRPARVGRWGVS